MKIRRQPSIWLVALVLAATWVSLSPSGQAEEGWSYQLVPLYLWAQSSDGTAVVGDQTIPVVLDFSDAVNALDDGFTFHFEGWKGDWGLLLDYTRLRLAGVRRVGALASRTAWDAPRRAESPASGRTSAGRLGAGGSGGELDGIARRAAFGLG